MRRKAFLTGITGLLGSYLARELLKRGYVVFALARSSNGIAAKKRVIEILKFVCGDEIEEKLLYSNLVIIEDDITRADFGKKMKKENILENEKIDAIYHCAALTNLVAPLKIHRMVNVAGTRKIIELAMNLRKCNPLLKLCHISTVFVVGKYDGRFSESNLDNKQSFNNSYEQSKYEAEKLLKEYIREGLNIVIFRPSMIVGDYKDGKTSNFRLIYQPLKHFAMCIFDQYPGDLDCELNMINVDKVASSILSLTESGNMPVYHIVSPNSITLRFLLKSAEQYFKFKSPKFIPAIYFNQNDLTPVQQKLIKPFVPYLNSKKSIVSEDTLLQLHRLGIILPEIDASNLGRLFNYCRISGFIKDKM
jgi:thioester reductase-like protein